MFGSMAKICDSGFGYEASVSRAGGLSPTGAIVALIGTPRSSPVLSPAAVSGIGLGVFPVGFGGLHACQSTPESSAGSHDSWLSSSGVPTGLLSFPVRLLGCIRSQITVSTGNLGGKHCVSSLSAMKPGQNKHLLSIAGEEILETGVLLSHIRSRPRCLSFGGGMLQVSETFEGGLKFRVFFLRRGERYLLSFMGERLLPNNDPTMVSFGTGVGSFFAGAGELTLPVVL